jgi:hypothetical protein
MNYWLDPRNWPGALADATTRLTGRWQYTAQEPPNRLKEIHLQALELGKREVGNGEQGSNNRGRDVVRYRRGQDNAGPWCAAFLSYLFEESAARLGYWLPFQRTHLAQQLYRRVAAAGRSVDIPNAGDVICWERGDRGGWQGHVGLVILYLADMEDTLIVLEGNRGPFPAKVNEFSYPAGKWRRRLVGVGRLW